MTNKLLRIKIQQRLNKLASYDYDNIECWQIQEAFNKAQVEWVRRQLSGTNMRREGDEQSTRRIDDLQILLTSLELNGTNKTEYFESSILPDNYLQFKRVSAIAKDNCCDKRKMTVFLAEEGDVDLLLKDELKKPDFDWAETFCTISGNKIKVYRTEDFKISATNLTYYRKPVSIQFEDCINLDKEVVTAEVQCEFKDDIVELIIDDAASILAGDIESMNQFNRNAQNAEKNN